MAIISQIKLPNNDVYSLKDNGALQLTGGQVTGPVTFGDSISVDEATIGDLVVNGSASFTNNLQVNTINGVAVGNNPKFTGTITKVTTTAGAHTAVDVSSGAVSFNVPTKTSHLTNDSGFVTTDENVKQVPIGDTVSTNYGLVVAFDKGSTETTNYVRSTNKIYINNSTPALVVGKSTDTQRLSVRPDRISFIYNSNNLQGYLKASNITASDKTWTLPDKTGTIALIDDTFKSTTATLSTTGWSSNTKTVNVTGVTASNIVIVSPTPTSYDEYSTCGIYCSAQAANSLTFTCSEIPSSALTVNVLYK